MSSSNYYIGLISGTSVDGVDCALVDFADGTPLLVAAHTIPLTSSLRDDVLQLCLGNNISLSDFGNMHKALGLAFAEAANQLVAAAGLQSTDIQAIGSHGQTVWHEPHGENPFTLQIADPNTIAYQTGIKTVADLRGMDMAAGGQGAPLAPLLHRAVFYTENVDRVIVNIGGFSNITALPRDGSCFAFDTGPGNVLMDYWVNKHRNEKYDNDGAWAASGQMQPLLLNALLDEDYFRQPPPKSTGRELFNGPWLESKLAQFESNIPAADVQATLLTFTATTIAADIQRYAVADEVYICGGGAHNSSLMLELTNVLAESSVMLTSELGIDPDWVEAIAFAWMAKAAIENTAVDTAPFTGASNAVKLGGLYSP